MVRARHAVADVLKQESFQHVEGLRTRASCPMSRFGVIKLTWDETPQRVSQSVDEMEKLFGVDLWDRLKPRAWEEAPRKPFQGGTAAGSKSTVTVQIMQKSSHIRIGRLMEFTGPLFHPLKVIETNSASNIMRGLCESSPFTTDFLREVNRNDVNEMFQ